MKVVRDLGSFRISFIMRFIYEVFREFSFFFHDLIWRSAEFFFQRNLPLGFVCVFDMFGQITLPGKHFITEFAFVGFLDVRVFQVMSL